MQERKKKGIKEIEVKRADDTRLRKQSDGVRKRRGCSRGDKIEGLII